MSESLKGVARLIEIGTVAIQSGPDMGEMYFAIEDGRIGILILVEMEHVGMHQIDALVLHPRLTGRTFPGTVLLGIDRYCRQQNAHHQPEKSKLPHDFLDERYISATIALQ